MKALWRRLAERVDSLAPRERALVFAAAVGVVALGGYSLFIEAAHVRNRQLARDITQMNSESAALQEQVIKILQTGKADPNREERERLARLRREMQAVNEGILAEERKFTAPSQMRRTVEGMLVRNRGVQLLDLKTLPVTSIAEAIAEGRTAEAAAAAKLLVTGRLVYRHGMELTVAGRYLDLLAYLRDLEGLPTQLYWAALEVDAENYPRLVMKLTVYTLSLDRAWMNV